MGRKTGGKEGVKGRKPTWGGVGKLPLNQSTERKRNNGGLKCKLNSPRRKISTGNVNQEGKGAEGISNPCGK